MNPYICVTYAHDDRQQFELFCRSLSRYGFRYNCISELSTHDRRGPLLGQSAILIALTSETAARVETVASDIRHALERGLGVLCVSLKDNELDHRFCTGTEGGATLIPFPADDIPDRHALALFVHRLYVRHLARLSECFVEARCDDNVYGQLIRCAYYAHAGDNDACYELGRAYELGLGVPALEKEAAIWLKRAADRDVCDALIRMGCLYLSGTGTERNPEEAFRLFSRAADLGDIRGVYHRGLCYLEGHGVMKDPVHAIECLKSAACTQHAPSMYRLALLHRDGIGTERNVRTALKYLYAVCYRGYDEEEDRRVPPPISLYRHIGPVRYTGITMRQMRNTHLNAMMAAAPDQRSDRLSVASADRSFGRNTVTASNLPEDRWEHSLAELYNAEYEKDPEAQTDKIRSFAIYESDWTRADAALAAFDLGCILAVGSKADRLYASPTRALVWYRYAARLGHTEALYAMGDAYRRGYGAPADTKRAVDLFRLAAEGGSERGRFAYAVCCERGIGVSADPREAFRFYELAALNGYAPAQNNLGGCYEYALGTPQNLVAAVEWYASAANAGQCDGQCRLGICYELGRGVSVDMEKAIRLYELAADHGHAYALYRRALCYDRGRGHREPADATDTAGDLQPTQAKDRTAGETEGSRVAIDHTRAASLYRRSADLGVPEGAYAFYLCHRLERGLARDEHDEILYLRRASEGGCLQAAYELGLCYMEGNGLPKDQSAAVAQFNRAVELWRIYSGDSRMMAYISELDGLPPDAFSPRRAAGGALYMLAYCALYGLGETEDNREVDLYTVPGSDRVKTAVSLLREAAKIGHAGSLVMLGDLYAYGLLNATDTTPEDKALEYYLEAVRAKTGEAEAKEYTRDAALRDPTDQTIHALMSLAERALDESRRDNRREESEVARINAWRSYSEGAARGSADALVAMAECLYFGLGTSLNQDASVKLLRRAESLDGGRIAAALWLGDALRMRKNDPHAAEEADEVYLRGLERPCRESENGPYTLGLRRVDRKRADIRARSEILYRLATLRAVHFSGAADHRDSFLYLAEAILMGHAVARDDLARMFAMDSKRTKGPALKASRGDRKSIKIGRKAKLRQRMKEHGGILNRSSIRASRIHQGWLSDYYNALCPKPEPFSYAMRNTAILTDAPEYTTVTVTDLMRANALQYLGECFFEGYGLPVNTSAAVTCYRAVLACAPKGGPTPPTSVMEATYSLGWCLLHGVGTAADHREALRLLTSVSRSHPGACYTLGLCHEEGLGVVAADDREALKFYRKAQRLGHPKAAEKVAVLEKRLLERVN